MARARQFLFMLDQYRNEEWNDSSLRYQIIFDHSHFRQSLSQAYKKERGIFEGRQSQRTGWARPKPDERTLCLEKVARPVFRARREYPIDDSIR